MLRQSLIYLLLSILIVVFAKYAHLIIVYIDMFFTHINVKLTPVFSQTGWGLLIRKIIVLMALPLIIAGIPSVVYKGLKGRDMPYFLPIVWLVWTVIVLSDILVIR